MITAGDFDQKLKNFSCKRCGECCRQPGFVYLNEGEAEKIAEWMAEEIYKFTNRFCDLQDRSRLVLKKRDDETCIFLKGKDCVIYPVRPRQCRDFPLHWRTAGSFAYCEGLKALINE